jgi:outer membrane lipoprotein SlyB
MELSQQRSAQPYGLLYPLMLIAAIAVIVFSILGIATIAGWMPGALSAASAAQPTPGTTDRTIAAAGRGASTFDCAECGMIETIRAIERSDPFSDVGVAGEPGSRL